MRIIDSVDDFRVVEESGDRAQPFRVMARFMEVISKTGDRFHAEEPERWWPCKSIPWLGFDVDTEHRRVEVTGRRRKKGRSCVLGQ